MKKIPTVFERDWDGNRSVVPQYIRAFDFATAIATEKLDGTNVRVTVRGRMIVRLEKRRNPSKLQKKVGITEPWYMDGDPYAPEDKHIFDAVAHTKLADALDGEWEGEAVGPKIQGNPLGLDQHTICLFSLGQAPEHLNAPTSFAGLKEWLPRTTSRYGSGLIEGIVWHWPDGLMAKIKTRDFK